jgi:hypothetical protein
MVAYGSSDSVVQSFLFLYLILDPCLFEGFALISMVSVVFWDVYWHEDNARLQSHFRYIYILLMHTPR